MKHSPCGNQEEQTCLVHLGRERLQDNALLALPFPCCYHKLWERVELKIKQTQACKDISLQQPRKCLQCKSKFRHVTLIWSRSRCFRSPFLSKCPFLDPVLLHQGCPSQRRASLDSERHSAAKWQWTGSVLGPSHGADGLKYRGAQNARQTEWNMEGFVASVTSNFSEKKNLQMGWGQFADMKTQGQIIIRKCFSWVNHGFSGFSFIALVHVTETCNMQTLVSHISLKNWKKLWTSSFIGDRCDGCTLIDQPFLPGNSFPVTVSD